MNIIKEIGNLQKEWEKLLKNNSMTKRAIIDLVKPFRDKYNLTDSQALQIARNEVSFETISDWLSEIDE